MLIVPGAAGEEEERGGVGVRVDYALSRTFTLFGGYRLNESSGEAYDDVLNTGFVSSARFGLRYRF